MTIPGLTAEDSSLIILAISGCKEVEQAILYGSRANGNYKTGSDIDITLARSNLNLHILNDLTAKCAELPIPYTFDISILHQINSKNLPDPISRMGISLYTRNQQNT